MQTTETFKYDEAIKSRSLFDFMDPEPEVELQGDKICFYDAVEGKLHGRRISKAQNFLKHSCIEMFSVNELVCRPIEGYNKTTYLILRNMTGGFSCNCQYNRLKGKTCSHIIAAIAFLKRGGIE